MNWKKILKVLLLTPIIILILGLIFIAIYLYSDSTGILISDEQRLFQDKLRFVVESEAKEINIRDLTNFEWDKVCFGIRYNYKTHEIDKRVETWPIDFINQGKQVNRFEVDKKIAELKPLKEDELKTSFCYKNEIILKLDKKLIQLENDGWGS